MMTNRIKQLRLEHDMSQRDLSEKIGCSQKSIDYWEKGAAEPTARFICALADCFECSADYLLGREDDFGNVSVVRELTERERIILQLYGKLSVERQQAAFDYLEFLAGKEKGNR